METNNITKNADTSLNPLRMTGKLKLDQVNWRNGERTIFHTSSSDLPTAKRKSALSVESLLASEEIIKKCN